MNHALNSELLKPAGHGLVAEVDTDAEREFTEFQRLLAVLESPAVSPHERPSRGIRADSAVASVSRWQITFSGRINLRRINAFRARIATWDQTIHVKVEDVSAQSVRLRLVTDARVKPHFVDRMVRACRERAGVPGRISIHTA